MNQEPVRELIDSKLDAAMEDIERSREWLATLSNEVERFENSIEKALLHLDNLRAWIETNGCKTEEELENYPDYVSAKQFLREWS